jgi:hypothetical protein
VSTVLIAEWDWQLCSHDHLCPGLSGAPEI